MLEHGGEHPVAGSVAAQDLWGKAGGGQEASEPCHILGQECERLAAISSARVVVIGCCLRWLGNMEETSS